MSDGSTVSEAGGMDGQRGGQAEGHEIATDAPQGGGTGVMKSSDRVCLVR